MSKPDNKSKPADRWTQWTEWTQLGRRRVFCPFSPFCPHNNKFEKELVHTGAKSQKKGRAAELEICRIFQAHGIDARPGDPVSYGSTPDVVNVPGIHPEIKRCEQARLNEWLAQTERDAAKFRDGAPTIFHRKNHQQWLATMYLEDWISLYQGKISEKIGKED